jgi:predicted nucleic acid-binding protein
MTDQPSTLTPKQAAKYETMGQPATMRAVLDTSVIVSAMRSRHGASNRLLQLAYARSFQMLATPALFLEYEDVLGRNEQRAVHGMSPERTAAFLIGIAAIIEPVKVYYRWRPRCRMWTTRWCSMRRSTVART